MRTLTVFVTLLVAAATLAAQGPGPGRGMGPGMGPGGGMGMMMAPGSRTPITGAPYSGVQNVQIQQTLATGNQINRQETTKVFRDGQGRVRMEHTMTDPAGQTHTMIGIFDPVAGFHYTLNPADKTAVKMPMPTGGQGRQGPPAGRGPRAGQVQTDDLGTQTINGLVATGTRVTETVPAGAIGNQQPIQIVRETWISTALKVPVQIKTTDPRFGNTTMQLTGVVQAEPDPSLFQVPADYTVTTRQQPGMRPGGMMRRQPPAI